MILSDSELVEMLREPRTRREGFAVLVKQYSEKTILEGASYRAQS